MTESKRELLYLPGIATAPYDRVPGAMPTRTWACLLHLRNMPTPAYAWLGFEPVVSFREGLERSIDWYRKNLA